MNKLLLILCLLFTLASFAPVFNELYHIKDMQKDREFVLEHNYMFDYNFYLSRIREGQEGYWMVTERYYNHPHQSSLFQVVYLYLGKLGKLGGLGPPEVYHVSRFLFGFAFLYLIGAYAVYLLPGWWGILGFVWAVVAGSWPILQYFNGGWRSATYMGWWSVTDPLLRITTIPHILIGQIGILLFVWRFSVAFPHRLPTSLKVLRSFIWGIVGLVVGIIFPPTLVVVYAIFGVQSVLELIGIVETRGRTMKQWLLEYIVPRGVFFIVSMWALAYMSAMFQVMPWSALALFDIQHRMPLPYKEWFLAMGPMLPLGIIGGLWALIKRDVKFFPSIAWIAATLLLCQIFENIPTQSPLRFTEAAMTVPLGILTGYLFYQLWDAPVGASLRWLKLPKVLRSLRILEVGIIVVILVMSGFVMYSQYLWQRDSARWKREGTWQVPIGAQIAYPLKEFMNAVYFFRDTIPRESVVLTYVTAGNFIPAYAGQSVYIGHANIPDEDGKEGIARMLFGGKNTQEEVKEFLKKERINYIFYGPQERDFGEGKELSAYYPFLTLVYANSRVTVYKFEPTKL